MVGGGSGGTTATVVMAGMEEVRAVVDDVHGDD